MCLPLKNLDKRTLAQGEYLGFGWQIVANHRGYRCGYIRVEPGHPWFGKSHDEVDVEVHGGLSFGDAGTACPTHDEKAEYWYGFDCGHGGDAPDLDLMDEEARRFHFADLASFAERFAELEASSPYYRRETIKDTAYVERECRSLCEQAAAAMSAAA